MNSMQRPVTLGVIVGNRGFFPSHLADTGRKTVLRVLEAEGISAVCLGEGESQFGAVFSLEDSHKCSDLFRAHRDEIDGILVTLPNFGEETAIANAIRWADLNVPVLVHAFPDDPAKMTSADRRDSFCGKMSCCNNLSQVGVRYSLTRLHGRSRERGLPSRPAGFRRDVPDGARAAVGPIGRDRRSSGGVQDRPLQ
jgi:L-fucose isomerase-like protein